eukprot:754399-Hanusia_phi.AAC.1
MHTAGAQRFLSSGYTTPDSYQVDRGIRQDASVPHLLHAARQLRKRLFLRANHGPDSQHLPPSSWHQTNDKDKKNSLESDPPIVSLQLPLGTTKHLKSLCNILDIHISFETPWEPLWPPSCMSASKYRTATYLLVCQMHLLHPRPVLLYSIPASSLSLPPPFCLRPQRGRINGHCAE